VTKRFDAILFDAGGIFLLPDPISLGAIVHAHGGDGSVEKMMRAHYAGMERLDSIASELARETIEGFSWDSYRDAYVEAAGITGTAAVTASEQLQKMFSPFLWRYPILESAAALWRMHLQGLPIGIVSNASGQVEATLANQCICQVGTGAGVPVLIVTDSHVIGTAKPHPGIFRDALALMNDKGIGNDRIAYVGDSYVNDVEGARNADVHPILLDPYDDHASYDCERISSLHDLLAFI
jgi:putative hydrolase of the HAD superfamily